jgi:hypothetical protein
MAVTLKNPGLAGVFSLGGPIAVTARPSLAARRKFAIATTR